MPQGCRGDPQNKTRKGEHQSSHLLWKTVTMCQAFTCQGSGNIYQLPALASPDTTIKAQELMISPCENSSKPSCRAGLCPWSMLATCYLSSPRIWSTEPLRCDLEHKVNISFKVHFPSSCRADPVSELWRHVSCYCIKAVTEASCWQEPKQLALTAQPVNPRHSKPPPEHQISHPFPQRPLFRTHHSISWGKDIKNLSRLWDSIFNTTPSSKASVDHFFSLLSRRLAFWSAFKTVACLQLVTAHLKSGTPKWFLVTNMSYSRAWAHPPRVKFGSAISFT